MCTFSQIVEFLLSILRIGKAHVLIYRFKFPQSFTFTQFSETFNAYNNFQQGLPIR